MAKMDNIFIHVPKTGGTSMLQISFVDDRVRSKHPKAVQVRNLYGSKIWDDCLTWGFVRNPYDRFVSLYHFYRSGKAGAHHAHITACVNEYLDFGSFVMDYPGFKYKHRLHFADQSSWLCDGDLVIVDYVGAFEQLQDDFDELCVLLGYNAQKLPHKQKSYHPQYTKCYNAETADIIYNEYKRDFEIFNYYKESWDGRYI